MTKVQQNAQVKSVSTIPAPIPLLLRGITLLLLGVSIAFISDIGTRLLSEGSEMGRVLLVGFLGGLSVVSFDFVLSTSRHTILSHIAQRFLGHLPGRLRKRWLADEQIVSLTVVLLIFFLLLSFYPLKPQIALYFHNQGADSFHTGQLSEAEERFKTALQLDPENPHTHYFLGRIYEEVQDNGNAKTQYALAVREGSDLAHNDLGRLLILDGEPHRAVPVLRDGLRMEVDEETRYTLLKNLAWAKMEQGIDLNEAKEKIEEAVALRPDYMDAHCVYAQIIELQGNNAEEEWFKCFSGKNAAFAHRGGEQDSERLTPEQEMWIDMAEQRLQ